MLAAWMLYVLAFAEPLACSTPTFDAGRAYVGQRLVHKFALRNSSTEIVTITDVRGSCGCAAPEISRRQLQPGESAELTVDVNSLSQPAGPVRWNTHVEWRCGDHHGRSTYEVTAHLIREIEIEPAALALHALPGFQHEIRIHDRRANPFRVTGIRTDSRLVQAEYSPERQTIQVRISDSCPEGTSRDVIAIATSDPKYPELRVPITVTRKTPARVAAYPARPTLTANASVLVQLRGKDGETVRVKHVEAGHPGLTARWTEGPGESSTLRIGLDKTRWDGQGLTSEVRVRLAAPACETLTIPVTVRIDD
jgi:hypothetical protein